MGQDEAVVSLEPAKPTDLASIEDLLRKSGLPTDGIKDCIPSAVVIRTGGKVIGAAALEVYSDTALVRSVAVENTYQGRGLGRWVTEGAMALGLEKGVRGFFLLTEDAQDFFTTLGFRKVERATLPSSIQNTKECTSLCPNTATAMALKIGKK